MSLQYIIDGYNVIKHSQFNRIHKHSEDPAGDLLAFIRIRKPALNSQDKVLIVFDGYPKANSADGSNPRLIFSRKISADEKIKRIVEESADRKNLVVVSDDRELQIMVKACGARCMAVEEFIATKTRPQSLKSHETLKPELSFTEIHKINQELRKIWLK